MGNKYQAVLKLKSDFFRSDSMIYLESIENGFLYSNILLKLYLRSLKHEGRLLMIGKVPYDAGIIAHITGHEIEVAEQALQIFQDIGLITITDGVMTMNDIHLYKGYQEVI